jgi:hypothetical protein
MNCMLQHWSAGADAIGLPEKLLLTDRVLQSATSCVVLAAGAVFVSQVYWMGW